MCGGGSSLRDCVVPDLNALFFNLSFDEILLCFPEMAERHSTKQILKLARDLVYKVQTLIENK